jgi:hypothetical protein
MPLSDHVNDLSIAQALDRAGHHLSFTEVQRLVWAALDENTVTQQEINDLREVLRRCDRMNERSRRFLQRFVDAAQRAMPAGTARIQSTAAARQLIRDFASQPGTGQGAFLHLDRTVVALALHNHVRNPGCLNQGRTELCGPTSFMYSLVRDNPVAYVELAISLFRHGRGRAGQLRVRASGSLRRHRLPETVGIDQAHWMIAASIADSENLFVRYNEHTDRLGGLTRPQEILRWFRGAGYTNIRSDYSDLCRRQSAGNARQASRLHSEGYRVCLSVHANLMYENRQTRDSRISNHWVVLTRAIQFSPSVRLGVFSWGDGNYEIPHGSIALSVNDFLDNYYGYVAASY